MQWTVSELHMLARHSCSNCHGSGVHRLKESEPLPCGCALRGVFRACYRRFRDCVSRSKYRAVSFERTPQGKTHRGMWSRKEEEYTADFELVSRRHLDEFHHRIFRYYFLLGADWSLCCRRLTMSRGNFYHALYRIEQHLGRVFYELEPYPLYPPRNYFAVRLGKSVKPSPIPVKPDRVMPREFYTLGEFESLLPLAV